jgi:predicted DNA-binding transcriptional regulator
MKQEETFYTTYDWMVDIGLSSNDLNLYALIYSFTKDGNFRIASRSYLAKRIGCSVITVYKSIQFLQDNGLLEKREVMKGNVLSVEYKAIKNLNPIKNLNTIKKLNNPIKKINRSPIKKLNTNNKDNNKKNNKGKLISKDIIKKSEKELIFDDGMKNAYPRVMHMPKPLTYEQYNKLLERYSKEIIRETLEAMENYRKLDTYDSAYRTLNNWLKRNLSKNKNENNRRNNPIDNIDRAREQAIRESMELIRKAEERNTQV